MNLKQLIISSLALVPLTAWSDSDIAPPSEEAPWYQVNIVIFKQPDHLLQSEQWKAGDELNLSLPNSLLSLETPQEVPEESEPQNTPEAPQAEPTYPAPFMAMQTEDEEFTKTVNRLTRSPNYEILYQNAWLQPPLEEDSAIPVLIQAGEVHDGLYELEGTTKLHVSRYLHFSADLWLSKYIQQIEVLKPWWQESTDDDLLDTESNPNQFNITLGQEDIGNDIALSPSFNQMDTSISMGETVTRYKSARTGVMHESRRMRSGELHYIDHPLFGMIIKVVPYFPEEKEPEGDDLALLQH